MEFEKSIVSIVLSVAAAGLLGLAYSFWQSYGINKPVTGNQKTTDTASSIKTGVITYITAEYKFLLLFVLSLGIILFFYGKSQENLNWLLAISFLVGAVSTAAAGYFSMRIASAASEKVVTESQNSYAEAHSATFSASNAIGIIGVSSVVVGLTVLLTALTFLKKEWEFLTMENVIAGYALGATSIVLFARLGGSLFANSSDKAENEIVSAETGINEKSYHNPSSVSNETGKIVSNIGGIGADFFESASATIIAAMFLGANLLTDEPSNKTLLVLPLIIFAIGIFSSIGASFLLKSSEVSTTRKAMNFAEIIGAAILSLATFFAIKYLLPAQWDVTTKTDEELIITTYKGLGIFWSVFLGIVASVGIGYITKIYTGKESKTVKNIVDKSTKGTANNILGGIEAGLISTGIPVAVLLAVTLAAHYFAGFYGVGIAAVGFFGNMGLQYAYNAAAPIADNANSIAQKTNIDELGIVETNNLKTIGIQSIAQGKIYLALGASIGVVALIGAFIQQAGLMAINLTNPIIIASLAAGTLLPFILSSNALAAVNRISTKIVNEVKRQFIDIPALADAKEILDKYNGDLTYATEGEKEIVYSAQESADNNQCIEIAAYSTIWETLIPGIIAITIPVLVAFFGNAEMLAALLFGALASGTLMAVYQANTGSSLESTKYALEEGVVKNGELLGKESSAYESAVIGENTGKPIKDAASPAVVVLVKLLAIVAIILVPLLVNKAKKSKGLHVNNQQIEMKTNHEYSAQNTYRY